MKKGSRVYDRNFKVEAVQLGYRIGCYIGARELGISPSLIIRWRQELREYGEASFCGHGFTRLNDEQKRFCEQKRKLKKELKNTELKIEIFKNASKYTSGGKIAIFQFIKDHSDKYAISKMCNILGTSVIAYKKWKNQLLTPTKRQTQILKEEIISIFYEYKELYGGPKIAAELQSRGFKIKTGQVCIHMRNLGLVSKIRRNYRLKTASIYNPYMFPNILNQKFIVEEPSKVWVSGIIRLKTSNGFLFLTIIMDLFDRKIIGWNLSNGLTVKETTLPVWEMAVKNRKVMKGLIFHSHSSSQYASRIFSNKLDSYKFIRRSMDRKVNRSDNTISGDSFNSLKSELIDSKMLITKKQMQEKIFEYFENQK
ncbi:IS3 family transposase [Flavobacterium sp. TR2]|uniref:IS3 family transposase n=1 Tax=Flavobacterium sp. TR2 TaxID=2977321 RepID=UPI0021B0A4C1|nr:IS3 family transposase [Flavobacterium sp. TR2]UWY26927.1 IS3 family transposase [Flavobacterium sp. TR2]